MTEPGGPAAVAEGVARGWAYAKGKSGFLTGFGIAIAVGVALLSIVLFWRLEGDDFLARDLPTRRCLATGPGRFEDVEDFDLFDPGVRLTF